MMDNDMKTKALFLIYFILLGSLVFVMINTYKPKDAATSKGKIIEYKNVEATRLNFDEWPRNVIRIVDRDFNYVLYITSDGIAAVPIREGVK